MEANRSVAFFDEQFRRQLAAADFALNPFESAALPHLHGHVLDYGCGLGSLALAAARGGCTVLALAASTAAIEHLRAVAEPRRCRWAPNRRTCAAIASRGSIAEDFDAVVCILSHEAQECPAPRGTRKVFATVVARKPLFAPSVAPPAAPPAERPARSRQCARAPSSARPRSLTFQGPPCFVRWSFHPLASRCSFWAAAPGTRTTPAWSRAKSRRSRPKTSPA
jgi:SAM-dependent methyltransferase